LIFFKKNKKLLLTFLSMWDEEEKKERFRKSYIKLSILKQIVYKFSTTAK